MTDEQRVARVYWIELDAVQHQVADRDACGRLAWKKESGDARALRIERLDPLLKRAERRRRRSARRARRRSRSAE